MTKLWTPGDRDRQWQLGYNNLYSIINDSSLIIMPLGDPRYFAGSGTFKTTGDIQATFTPSSDPRTWATPYNHTQLSSYTPGGLIPQLTFDGSANEFDSPDADAWSFGADGTAGNEPAISLGIWLQLNTTGWIFGRVTSAQVGEYSLDGFGGDVTFRCIDQSANARIGRATAVQATAAWLHVVATYSGNQASSGINVYINGVDADTTDSNFGSYVAMENNTITTTLSQNSSKTAGQLFDGSLAGASCCPWIVGKELTADEVNRIYRMQHSQMFGYYP